MRMKMGMSALAVILGLAMLARTERAGAGEAAHFTTEDGKKCFQMFMEGQTAYKAKDFKKYLELNQKVLEMKLSPEALAETQSYRTNAQYNAACGYALAGDKEKALDALGKAVDMGFDKAGDMRADADLASIRDDKRFKEVVERAGKLAQAAGGKITFRGELMRMEHAGRLALALTPGEKNGGSPVILRLEFADKALAKKTEELLQKKSAVQVEGQGGTESYEMMLNVSSIAAAAEPSKK